MGGTGGSAVYLLDKKATVVDLQTDLGGMGETGGALGQLKPRDSGVLGLDVCVICTKLWFNP